MIARRDLAGIGYVKGEGKLLVYLKDEAYERVYEKNFSEAFFGRSGKIPAKKKAG